MQTFSAATLMLLASLAAHADQGRVNAPALPLYKQECSACHIAYAPSLLPAASWRNVMNGLTRHYGTDASLDAASVAQLSGWLEQHAATRAKYAEPAPDDRITRAPWFVRKHRKVEPAVWQRASIRSASNCAACHTNAAEGNFDEHRIRIPAK